MAQKDELPFPKNEKLIFRIVEDKLNEAYPNTLHFLKAINDAGTFSDIFFPYRSNAMIDVKKRIREAVNRENLPKDILNIINRPK